jgi:hypothetical protein
MATRDHVIHPFQTFLLGTLVINSYQREFLEAIADDFGIEKKKIYDSDCNLSKEGKALQTFLKASWFVCSTMHDIGYPIEVFDKLSEALRKQIGVLLNLDEGLLSQPERLRIDHVMYDDPRTEIVLLRLVNGLYDAFHIPEQFEEQFGKEFLKKSLNWIIRRFAFVDKHHDIASMLALALMFLKCDDPGHVNELTEEKDLSPVEKHVLLPVMLHHVLDWSGRIEKLKAKVGNTEEINENVNKNATAIEMLDPLLSLFGGCNSCREEIFKHGLIKFEELPLAILLTICDLFQEWGRPGYTPKKHFPYRIDGQMNFVWNHFPTLEVKLNYNNAKDCLCLQQKDYNDRKPRVEKIDHIYDRGPLKAIRAEFSSNIGHNDPIPLERTDWGVYRIIEQCLDICRKDVEMRSRELAYLIRTCLATTNSSDDYKALAELLKGDEEPMGGIYDKLKKLDPGEELKSAWKCMVNKCYKGKDKKTQCPSWRVAKATEMATMEKSKCEKRDSDPDKWANLWTGDFESQRYTAYFLPVLNLLNSEQPVMKECTNGLITALKNWNKKSCFVRKGAPVWCVPDTVLSLLDSGVPDSNGAILKKSVIKSLEYVEKESGTQNAYFEEIALGEGQPKPVEDATAILFAAMSRTEIHKEKSVEFNKIGKYLSERLPKVFVKLYEKGENRDVLLRSACRIVWACSFAPEVFNKVEKTYEKLLKSVHNKWPEWIDKDELRVLSFCECLYLLVATKRQIRPSGGAGQWK